MSGWLSLLLFAAFFYFMMRFGCGAHMVHGGHGDTDHEGHDGTGTQDGPVKDPVCGMPLSLAKVIPGITEERRCIFARSNVWTSSMQSRNVTPPRKEKRQ